MHIRTYVLIAIACAAVSFVFGKYIFYKKDNSVVICNPTTIPFDLDGRIPEGPIDAPITIIEFCDLECHYSLRAHRRINKLLKNEKYNGKIKYYYKSYPLSRHKNGELVAKVILAAASQGKSKEMREGLFNELKTSRLKGDIKYSEAINQMVSTLGLDKKKLQTDSESEEIKNKILLETEDGKKHHVRATPTIFINGQKVKGAKSLDIYEAIINKFLSIT